MRHGALTPEELEILFEDAFVLRDRGSLLQLFEPGAVLVASDDLPEARGREAIVGVASEMWAAGRTYLADPRRIVQVGDTALVVAGGVINVARRGTDRSWRYAISLLDPPARPRG